MEGMTSGERVCDDSWGKSIGGCYSVVGSCPFAKRMGE